MLECRARAATHLLGVALEAAAVVHVDAGQREGLAEPGKQRQLR